jgi:triacylglycerol esterase/lipase EstA (alpha/beta hydrolase family)
MKPPNSIFLLCAAILLSACHSNRVPPEGANHRSAAVLLKSASAPSVSDEQRAALYLKSADDARALLASEPSDEAARLIYNKAAADLTVLLRSSGQGKLWNRPLMLSADGISYRLRFARGDGNAIWDPAYFTDFTPAEKVKEKIIRHRNYQTGIGGALVGVHKSDPLEAFSPKVGVAAPVTAILEFKGSDVVLTLIDPSEKPKTQVAGRNQLLEADFSAPLAYYPARSEIWNGLMGAISVQRYMQNTGLYMLQPYDPDRIPLIFVHGLISTPQMWRNVINELERDPKLRGRYQCWVFGYPTGNPPAYSALRFREELTKLRQVHPDAKDYVVVGHSMGGLVARMQVATLTRETWDAAGKQNVAQIFKRIQKKSMVERAVIFKSNPDIDRVVFICTPHRGSEMALGRLGALGSSLISLPADLAGTLASSLGNSVATITGNPNRMPNSVTGLSPSNPTLKVLDSVPLQCTHHSVVGDRGKGDTPNSSDGVVKYWSSHLKTAKSERIVPGPHGSCELPDTLKELNRILHLHLKESGGSRALDN